MFCSLCLIFSVTRVSVLFVLYNDVVLFILFILLCFCPNIDIIYICISFYYILCLFMYNRDILFDFLFLFYTLFFKSYSFEWDYACMLGVDDYRYFLYFISVWSFTHKLCIVYRIQFIHQTSVQASQSWFTQDGQTHDNNHNYAVLVLQ